MQQCGGATCCAVMMCTHHAQLRMAAYTAWWEEGSTLLAQELKHGTLGFCFRVAPTYLRGREVLGFNFSL